jgi:hypothetical protein
VNQIRPQHETTVAAAGRTFIARRHYEDGCWWADSDQAPGWTAAADTPTELYRLVHEAPEVLWGWPEGQYTVALLWADQAEV